LCPHPTPPVKLYLQKLEEILCLLTVVRNIFPHEFPILKRRYRTGTVRIPSMQLLFCYFNSCYYKKRL
jgi:hypothetical protein